MKSEKKRTGKVFLLKRSIGSRILLAVSLILLGVMLFIQFFTGNAISRYLQNYYTETGELIGVLITTARTQAVSPSPISLR